MMGLKASFSAMLMLTIVATNFNGVVSQVDCELSNSNVELDPFVSETKTGLFTQTVEVTGADTITAFAVELNSEPYNWAKAYVTVAPIAPNSRILAFTADATNFKDAMDLHRPTNGLLLGRYIVTCRNGNNPAYNVEGDFHIFINDTNSRDPVFEIENPYFALNLDTWQSNEIINFAEQIKVNDMDFLEEHATVTVTSANDIVTVEYRETTDDGNRGWNTTYNLYLNPDADYGNHTVLLKVTDGTRSSEKNITLYIGAGTQFQATALTVLLVSLASWFNLK